MTPSTSETITCVRRPRPHAELSGPACGSCSKWFPVPRSDLVLLRCEQSGRLITLDMPAGDCFQSRWQP
jgi:hypothetical protein